jgi:hypothetical protein
MEIKKMAIKLIYGGAGGVAAAVGEAASEFFSERDTVMFRSDTLWAAELCME